jgi:hypothetical protein
MSGNQFTVKEDGGGARYELQGSITEAADFKAIVDGAKDGVVLDLGGVERINSCGVREWIHLLEALDKKGAHPVLENCAVPMVRQFNMIETATRGAVVKSVMLPYFCPACDDERAVAHAVDPLQKAAAPDEAACPKCSGAMEFDDSPDAYFAFHKPR